MSAANDDKLTVRVATETVVHKMYVNDKNVIVKIVEERTVDGDPSVISRIEKSRQGREKRTERSAFDMIFGRF